MQIKQNHTHRTTSLIPQTLHRNSSRRHYRFVNKRVAERRKDEIFVIAEAVNSAIYFSGNGTEVNKAA